MMATTTRHQAPHSQFVRRLQEKLSHYQKVLPPIEPPHFLEVQRQSYEWFLREGLKELLRAFSPIEDYTGTLVLEFLDYELEVPQPQPNCNQCRQGACHQHKYFSPDACKERGLTYEASLRAKVRLIDKEAGEVKEWTDVYLGELPLMTPQGTFVVNGTERVVVSQLNRSSGVYFSSRLHELTGRELFLAQIVARNGNWVEFETVVETKQEERAKERVSIRVRIGGSKAMPATMLLKAFSALKETRGISPNVIRLPKSNRRLIGKRLAEPIIDQETGELLAHDNTVITSELWEQCQKAAIDKIAVYEDKLPCGTTEDIVRLFSVPQTFSQPIQMSPDELDEQRFWLLDDLIDPRTKRAAVRAPMRVTPEVLERINRFLESGLMEVTLYRCDPYISDTLEVDPAPDERTALLMVHRVLRPSEPATWEAARELIFSLFLDPRRYDLGRVGRHLLNRKLRFNDWLGTEPSNEIVTLTLEDLVGTLRAIILFREKVESLDEKMGQPFWGLFNSSSNGEETVIPEILKKPDWLGLLQDDVDHLKNKRLRSIGEVLQSQLRAAFLRMERALKERMATIPREQMSPQQLLSIKPLQAAIRSFFASGQLSQFLSQHNPLDELEHKRRMTALGPGGISRESAKGMLQLRDVHASHYGRICPIQTPEGPNIGLISTLAAYARVDEFGFIRTPYRVVKDGVLTGEIHWLAPDEDERFFIAPADTPVDEKGRIIPDRLIVRGPKPETGEPGYMWVHRSQVHYMDASPRQCFSVATNLIPFLEHDDANRALMGSNMQRQAVPLIYPEAPLVRTGLESKVARDSGALLIAEEDGIVEYVDASRIEIRTRSGEKKIYDLRTFKRSNQGTCWHQRPLVSKGQRVKKGDVLADGPATKDGVLALGRNLLVAFMVWEGYNYEDAIVISERLVKEDILSSIHIESYETTARDTKLGPEEITRDVPNVSEERLKFLDENGIIVIGAEVKSEDILVGKAVPKAASELSPEDRLMVAIFGKKAEDMRDSSLRVPPGEWGTVIGTLVLARYKYRCRKCGEIIRHWKKLERSEHSRCGGKLEQLPGDELKSGVNMMVRVYVAQRRKISVGDKLAGRHGNKGVIAKILPEADMPYLPDGTPVDIILSPLGVPSRMNIGQLLETHLGWLAHFYGMAFEVPPFLGLVKESDLIEGFKEAVNELQKEQLHKIATTEWKLKVRKPQWGEPAEDYASELADLVLSRTGEERENLLASLNLPPTADKNAVKENLLSRAHARVGFDPETGKSILYDGRTGEPFDQPVTIGWMFIMKLIHLVEDKVHARAVGPYSLVTQQPLGGKAQFGGQRLGEMEVWALEAYGAAYNLQEMLTVKSDDVHGRVQIFEDIAHGRNILEAGIPESFKILVKELQSLGLQVTVETRDGVVVELKDEEETTPQER
ncbi:MAG: DNA-directed RNA polymerase subunit beta [Armatimonadetes bacterium]|nr:DNA-directed RNA polymerase subunit beta [Armatimonadota bacterium]MCX7967045.1 DNA-directed RNA polymerase subunit beta [Armatimonadota bacterium]MDW8142537.1 DNA-directed RNA polymerase subunit beta [Armatimonadota bacterium]